MNYCPECGSSINGKPNFCPECGHKISSGSSQSDSENVKSSQRGDRQAGSSKDRGQAKGEVIDSMGMVLFRGVVSLFAAVVIAAGISTISGSVGAGIFLGVAIVLAGNFLYHYQIGKASVTG
jgi:uncharacterized membrane protein YvbJ